MVDEVASVFNEEEVAQEIPAEPAPSLEERFMNIIAELEARIEKLEMDAKKLKSGMPQIAF